MHVIFLLTFELYMNFGLIGFQCIPARASMLGSVEISEAAKMKTKEEGTSEDGTGEDGKSGAKTAFSAQGSGIKKEDIEVDYEPPPSPKAEARPYTIKITPSIDKRLEFMDIIVYGYHLNIHT